MLTQKQFRDLVWTKWRRGYKDGVLRERIGTGETITVVLEGPSGKKVIE